MRQPTSSARRLVPAAARRSCPDPSPQSKVAGPTWTVQQKRGRKVFSLGVWAPTVNIEAIRQQSAVERERPQYAKRRQADALLFR